MKIRFKQSCTDKNTGVLYSPNVVYEFDEKRAKEIIATGYAEAVEELKKSIDSEQPKDLETRLDEGEVVDLYSLSKKELVKLCKKQNLDFNGSKEELIERLLG